MRRSREASDKKKRVLFGIIVAGLAAVIAYSGYQMRLIADNNAKEAKTHQRLLSYKPASLPQRGADAGSQPLAPKANQRIRDLLEKYPDAVGWLTIAGTRIDYPFAQADDNDFYLHRDLDKGPLFAGTLFMDDQNSRDFSDFNTIIYGHHMKNGSMFGDLQKFNDKSFFDATKTGMIFLADKTYEVNFFAFAVINPNDPNIYYPTLAAEADKVDFLTHVKSASRYYRDLDVGPDNHLVTLSTCNYEFNNARMVLLGLLKEL